MASIQSWPRCHVACQLRSFVKGGKLSASHGTEAHVWESLWAFSDPVEEAGSSRGKQSASADLSFWARGEELSAERQSYRLMIRPGPPTSLPKQSKPNRYANARTGKQH